jgi:hypothetical protein
MRKTRKNKTIKKRNKKCNYTDEAKRIMKITKILRHRNKQTMKTMKNKTK